MEGGEWGKRGWKEKETKERDCGETEGMRKVGRRGVGKGRKKREEREGGSKADIEGK